MLAPRRLRLIWQPGCSVWRLDGNGRMMHEGRSGMSWRSGPRRGSGTDGRKSLQQGLPPLPPLPPLQPLRQRPARRVRLDVVDVDRAGHIYPEPDRHIRTPRCEHLDGAAPDFPSSVSTMMPGLVTRVRRPPPWTSTSICSAGHERIAWVKSSVAPPVLTRSWMRRGTSHWPSHRAPLWWHSMRTRSFGVGAPGRPAGVSRAVGRSDTSAVSSP
jgi:hypothetical protein